MDYTSNSSSSSQFIAACCGPIVTTWDLNEIQNNISHNYSTFEPYDASRSNSLTNGITSNSIVQDIAWNHNGHVIASCCSKLEMLNGIPSDHTSIENPDNCDVMLTNASTGINLDSFSSAKKTFADSTSNIDDSMKKASHQCTSISFGGRSRYLSVSSSNGTVAIWDLKKKSRVRLFLNVNNQTNRKLGNSPIPISKACFDPTDKYVAALSNSPYDSALRIYKLRESKLHSIHCEKSETSSLSHHHGGGASMAFSRIEKHQVAVGMNDGTFMIWDYTSPSSTSLVSSFENRHDQTVTGLEFSPIDKFVLASSSLDGTVVFHDISSQNIIRSIKPNYSNYRHNQTSLINNNKNYSESLGITCLDLHSDGVTCAAGTTSGHVMLYDLRKLNNEQLPLSIHDISPKNRLAYDERRYPVKSLQFQNRVAISSGTKIISSSSSITSMAMPTDTIHENNVNELESNFLSDVRNLKTRSIQKNKSEEKVQSVLTRKATTDSDKIQNKKLVEEYEMSSTTKDDNDLSILPLNITDSSDFHFTNSPTKAQMYISIDKTSNKIKEIIPAQAKNNEATTYRTSFNHNDIKTSSSNQTSLPLQKPIHSPSTPISPEAVQSFNKEFAFLESFQKKHSPTKRNSKKNKKQGSNYSPRNPNGHLSDLSDQLEQKQYANEAKSSLQPKYQASLHSDFTSMPVKSPYKLQNVNNEGKETNIDQLISTLSSSPGSQKLIKSEFPSHSRASRANIIEKESYRSTDNTLLNEDRNINVSNDNESIHFPIDKVSFRSLFLFQKLTHLH